MTRAKLCALLTALVPLACSVGDETDAARLGQPPRYVVPGCETLDHAACDVRATLCQTQLLELAACLRGDEPGALPAISLMSEAEYATYLSERRALAEPRPDPDHFERALVLLSLATPGAFSPPPSTVVERISGLYRNDTKDIVILDHGVDSDAASSSATLVHEFIHALQDREVDLTAFKERYGGSYDSFLALDSVIEGEARLHQSRYRASLLGLDPAAIDWKQAFQGALERDERWLFEQPSRYTASWSAFPYAWGARYMHFTWQAGALPGVLAQFASPPQTSQRLMASANNAVDVDITPSSIPQPTAPPSWMQLSHTVLGAWGTFLLIAAETDDTNAARDLALGWRGDGLWVYASSATETALASTAVVWRSAFPDATTAAAVAQLAARVVGSENVLQQGERVSLRATDGTLPIDWAF